MELLSRFWKRKDPSAFGFFSTAEEVTNGIDGSSLTAIVTGGTSGIGKETVRVLALRGAQVVMPARNMKTGNEVKQEILTENPNAKVNVMELNLASLSSVKNFAQSFSSLGRPLNILINNAGVMGCPFQFSKDGIELQFATNHLGHFLLTNLLLEKIKATARETGIEGRVINVASEAHRRAYPGGIHLDKINDKSSYKSMAAYGQSKVANILHSNELSRRLQAEGVNVTANSLHPGIIPTNIIRYIKIFAIPFAFVKFLLKSVPQGAATTCYLALHPDVKGVSGKYFKDCNESVPNSFAQDSNLAKELWQLSEELVSKAEESA